MATLNRMIRTQEFTHEGAPAAKISELSQLERSVMSCLLWENTFYESGEEIGERISNLVRGLCAMDKAEEVGAIAIQAKKDMRLRHVPLLIAVELAKYKNGKAVLKHVIPEVITRVDDITEFMAIYWRNGKCPVAKQVKKHLGEAYRKFDEYQLQKYNGGKKAVKLCDPLRLFRTKPKGEEQSALWGRLIKGELATPDTWEVELSKGGDKKASWTRLLQENKLMGLAMLRNLRNMREAGVDAIQINAGINSIQAGRLLPINFITAATHNPQFEPPLEVKFLECFGKKAKDDKATIILVDTSGSMDDKLSGRSELRRKDVAASLAMIGREIFSNLRIFTFADSVTEIPARHGFGLRDAINRAPSGGTRLGLAVKAMPKCERLIVITDEQSHDPVPQVKGGYMINVASNKNGVGYQQWIHIDGWSDKVLEYILRYEGAAKR